MAKSCGVFFGLFSIGPLQTWFVKMIICSEQHFLQNASQSPFFLIAKVLAREQDPQADMKGALMGRQKADPSSLCAQPVKAWLLSISLPSTGTVNLACLTSVFSSVKWAVVTASLSLSLSQDRDGL